MAITDCRDDEVAALRSSQPEIRARGPFPATRRPSGEERQTTFSSQSVPFLGFVEKVRAEAVSFSRPQLRGGPRHFLVVDRDMLVFGSIDVPSSVGAHVLSNATSNATSSTVPGPYALISSLRANDSAKATALAFAREVRLQLGLEADRVAAGPDESVVLYFFGRRQLPGGAHARHVAAIFEEEGAALSLSDKAVGTAEVLDIDVMNRVGLESVISSLQAFLQADGSREG